MLKNFFLLIIISAFSVSAGFAQSQDDRKQDEAAIRQIVRQIEAGWNALDGKAFAAPFAENADYVVVNGMHIKGRNIIDQGHAQIFSTIYKDSRNSATVKSIRFLRPDVAVVHVEWNLAFKKGGEQIKNHAYSTMFMTKENGKWSVAAFQNTPILTESR